MEITKAQKMKIEDLREYFKYEAKSTGLELTKFEILTTKYFVDVRATIGDDKISSAMNVLIRKDYQVFIGPKGAVKMAMERGFGSERNVKDFLNGNLYFITRDLKERLNKGKFKKGGENS